MRYFWLDVSIPLRWRSEVFCATVQRSTIGGLEICCITASMLRRLEGSITKRLRLLLRGDARHRSNNWVRAQCHCYTITSLLLVARLICLRSVLCLQGDFAALTVRYPHCSLAQVVCLDPISCPSLDPLFIIAILGSLCLLQTLQAQLMLGLCRQCRLM